jgi:hypothetical protein
MAGFNIILFLAYHKGLAQQAKRFDLNNAIFLVNSH